VIGYLSKSQEKKQRFERQKRRSKQNLCKSPGFYPIANRAIAKILKISPSTASKKKKLSEESGCIDIKRKRFIAKATPENYGVFKRLIEGSTMNLEPEILPTHILYQRLPDLIKPNLKYGIRKKIDQ
jgi:hypothetical protein